MYWRVPSLGKYWSAQKGEPNRQAFRELVEAGEAQGCLAFDGEVPVGWCSFGPREAFAYLSRARSLPLAPLEGVWAVTCFFVRAAYRNAGVSQRLIACAVREAERGGALHIEAYPTRARTSSPIPPVFAHTGLPGPFLREGFRHVADAGARCVLRRAIGNERPSQPQASPER